MFKKLLAIFVLFLVPAGPALANLNHKPYKQVVWPFEGAFGTFDRQSAQRGAQVYFQVCAACHSMNHLYYRNLSDIGFSEDEIKAIAAEKTVLAGPDELGETYERPGHPADHFVPPYPNEQAARAANNGAYPVDLSLIVKARPDGANYLYSLLTGYAETPPEDFNLNAGLHYNPYFEGGQLAMPAPLTDYMVEYMDGTPATVSQMARDVTIFMQWAAEPEMEHRKSMGIKVMLYLAIFTIVFLIAKKRIWKDVK